MSDFNSERKGTGTREWSERSFNLAVGCSHNCVYCYARTTALRFGLIEEPKDWAIEVPTKKAHRTRAQSKDGVVMLHTTHDITPMLLPFVKKQAKNEVEAGNQILLVSKPHLECIMEICEELQDYTGLVMWRFTIGTDDNDLLSLLEPGAPSFGERLASLEYAYERGFQTSVSMEPFLGSIGNAVKTFKLLEPYVTDTIWIGKLNKPEQRVDMSDPDVASAIKLIVEQQSDENIKMLYRELSGEKKVAWKDSIKAVVGE